MAQDYSTNLREALAMAGQRSTLAGRTMSPEQMAAIAQGVLTPYLGAYGTGMEQAYQADLEQAQAEKEYEMEQEALKQEEKAAETAAVGQFGSLALAGGHAYGVHGGGAATGAGTTSAGSVAYGGAYSEAAPATTGAGTGTTQGSVMTQGGWGSAFAFVGGGMVGYAVSPYGQQLEEGTGRPGSIITKPLPGGHSKRGGERMGMMATGAAGGGLATGGHPAGFIGGAVGGYLQENPETGKRGYQETYSWYIKPAWKGAIHDIKSIATVDVVKKVLQPREQIKKGYKRLKKLF